MQSKSNLHFKKMIQNQQLFRNALATGDVNVLNTIFSQHSSSLELLRFLTPFYIEVLAYSFQIQGAESPIKLAESALKDTTPIHDRLKSWFVSALTNLYTFGNPSEIADTLNEVIQCYNNQANTQQLIILFTHQIQDIAQLIDAIPYKHENVVVDFGAFNVQSYFGFLWVLYSYLMSDTAVYLNDIPSVAKYFKISINDQNQELKPAIKRKYKTPKDNVSYHFVTQMSDIYAPLWAHYVPLAIDFFSISAHSTQSSFFGESFRVTPDTLKTKSLNYESAPYATSGYDLPSASRNQNPHAILFTWDVSVLANETTAQLIYGSDFIAIFSNTLLIGYKATDNNLQAICLLSDIIDTVPCTINYEPLNHTYRIRMGTNQTQDTALLDFVISADVDNTILTVLNKVCDFIEDNISTKHLDYNEIFRDTHSTSK